MSDGGPPGDPPPVATHSVILPPPRTMVYGTRKWASVYGRVTTGKTREELINHPSRASSITTEAQAKRYLVKCTLINTDQDPDHSNLSLALLNIANTAPGITAIRANVICSIAILINSLPSYTTPPLPTPTQLNTHPSLKSQITALKECVEEVWRTTATNKTSAESLSRTIEEARNNLHSVAQYVGNTADELTGIPAQIKEAITNLNVPILPLLLCLNTTLPVPPTEIY